MDGRRWNIFIIVFSLISLSSLYGYSLQGITPLSKGSGLLLRCSVCMYVCMQRSRDRVHACAARMHRCYVRHSGVHLCARSCRIRSACAPRLADGWNSRLRYGYHIPIVDARGRGSGYGQLRFWLLGLLEEVFIGRDPSSSIFIIFVKPGKEFSIFVCFFFCKFLNQISSIFSSKRIVFMHSNKKGEKEIKELMTG